MTEPARGEAWDGEGRDPWLPERLAARAGVLGTEADIRETVWAALSRWLVQLSRRVLRGEGAPDLTAVWALESSWRAAVDMIIDRAIRPAMQRAYDAVLGEGFPFAQRAFVTSYLAEVRNRLVRVPDETYDLIAGQVAEAVNLGESIPKIRDRIAQTLDATATPRWSNRATVIARTEAVGSLNGGRQDAFEVMAAESDVPMERVWLSTIGDGRTRPSHVLADGQRVPMGQPFIVGGVPLRFPGDPMGPAQEVISCRCTHLVVEQDETVNMSNRQMRRR